MKRTILLTALFLSGMAAAQTPDTLHVKKVDDVMVITSPDAQTIVLKGSETDPDFTYRSSVQITPESSVSISENHFDLFSLDVLKPTDKRVEKRREPQVFQVDALEYIGLGICMTHDVAEGLDFTSRPFSELYVNLLNLDIRPGLGPVVLSTGIDLGYHSFRLGSDMFSKPEKNLLVVPVPDEWILKKSVLRSNYLSVPWKIRFEFGPKRRLAIFGGPELTYNFGGRTKNKYTMDGGRFKKKEKDIALEPWTWGYLAGVSIYGWNLFFRYSPCNVIQDGRGPVFQTYSFGIILD